jgi:uncharacterized protein YuzE
LASWSHGRYRLYLASGGTITIEGRVSVKYDPNGDVSDIEIYAKSFILAPRLEDMLAVERLPSKRHDQGDDRGQGDDGLQGEG